MSKLSLTNLSNLQNENTAVAAINANNANLISALDNTLSRDGLSPNEMEATLDMNSNRIINLPTAISTTEPITLAQMNTIIASHQVPNGLVTVGVPVSAAMQPVLAATTTASAVNLLGIHLMKNALDFGAVGDDATDNLIAANAAISYINTTGGFVYWPTGIYRFSAPFNPITSYCGGFLGDGSGSDGAYFNVVVRPVGTLFRSNFNEGNLITISSPSIGTSIRDIGFWPVKYRNSATWPTNFNSEIAVGDVSGNQTKFTGLSGLTFWYCAQGVTFSNAILCWMRDCNFIGTYGLHAIQVTGTAGVQSQGVTIDNCTCYNPYPGGAEPTVSGAGKTWTDWAASRTVATGDTMILGSTLWDCISGGTTASGGAGPVPAAYTASSGPGGVLATEVVDGSVHWVAIGFGFPCTIRLNAYSEVTWILNCNLLASYAGVAMQDDSGGVTPPSFATIHNCLINNMASDACLLAAGTGCRISDSVINYSATGRGITANLTGGLNVANSAIHNHALDGVLINGGSGHRLIGCEIVNNGRKTNNTYQGVQINNSNDSILTGNIIGPLTSLGAVGTQQYGVLISGSSTRNLVATNNLHSNGTAPSSDVSAGTNTISGNIT